MNYRRFPWDFRGWTMAQLIEWTEENRINQPLIEALDITGPVCDEAIVFESTSDGLMETIYGSGEVDNVPAAVEVLVPWEEIDPWWSSVTAPPAARS